MVLKDLYRYIATRDVIYGSLWLERNTRALFVKQGHLCYESKKH